MKIVAMFIFTKVKKCKCAKFPPAEVRSQGVCMSDSTVSDDLTGLCASDTPSQRVQFLLGTEDDDEEHIPHDLFTELDEICLKDGEEAEWRETAR